MYLCSPFRNNDRDRSLIILKDTRGKEKKISLIFNLFEFFREVEKGLQFQIYRQYSLEEKETKSERRMPRLPEPKKDVVSCDKPRGSANRN